MRGGHRGSLGGDDGGHASYDEAVRRVAPANLAAGLINKRWDLLASFKDRYVKDQKALGIGEALRITGELRDHVESMIPGWPTRGDREEDFETHRRVAAALSRTARPGAQVRSIGRPRPRRVR